MYILIAMILTSASHLVLLGTVGALTSPKPLNKDELHVWSNGEPVAWDEKLSKAHGMPSWFPEWNHAEEEDKKDTKILIYPKAKLAFCYFPKVASAEFNVMFNRLNGFKDEDLGDGIFGNSSPDKLGVKLKDITRANGWRFAFFTRDPLSRYLSAFGSKCLPKEDGSPGDVKYCGGLVGQTKKDGWQIINHPVSKEKMVEAFEEHTRFFMETLYTKKALKTDNRHYMRQVDLLDVCGRQHFEPSRVDFVGHLDQRVHRQVKDMLLNHKHSGDKVNVTQVVQLVDELFPIAGINGHTSSSTHSANDIFYRNETIKSMVRDMYSPDYDTLGETYPGDQSYYKGARP